MDLRIIFGLTLTYVLMCVNIAECRQMCWTCQYLQTGRGKECATAPANWTGGESRMKCPTKCIITAEFDVVTGAAKFFYRGCGESTNKNGCVDFGSSHNCFFACEGKDYCNDMSITMSPLIKGRDDISQSSRTVSSLKSAIFAAFVLVLHTIR